MPVADPQAGRPDARPEPGPKAPAPAAVPRPEPPKPANKPEPKVEPKPIPKPEVKPPPTPTKPAPVTKPEPKAEAKPVPKAETKPAPKPAPKTETKPAESYQDTLSAIDKLRRDKEMAELKEKLAALAGTDGRGTDAPLGEMGGKGKDAGVGHYTWLENVIPKYWNYSPYLNERLDLEATIKIFFDRDGKLLDYQFIKKSGSDQFDQSLIRAIIGFSRDQTLPNPPKERSNFEVKFNLKDMKK
ncbi:MAG: TonB C-terminal domain-containing protein [Desulfuromonadales bacterium]|nr:TonB C-terminal domain-containing protein [Desulfuromonadales bacterium]